MHLGHEPNTAVLFGGDDRVRFDYGGDGNEAGFGDPAVDQVEYRLKGGAEMLLQGFQHHGQRQHVGIVYGASDGEGTGRH